MTCLQRFIHSFLAGPQIVVVGSCRVATAYQRKQVRKQVHSLLLQTM